MGFAGTQLPVIEWTFTRISLLAFALLQVVHHSFFGASYVNGTHQDYNSFQKILTAAGDTNSSTLPCYPVHSRIEYAQRL